MRSPSEPVRSRREEYADATRDALLALARQVFTTEGYSQTGVEAISRGARVTRGAFYHHFADKQALFDALVVSLQAEAAAKVRLAAQNEADLADRVRVGAVAFLRICTDPTYRRLVIQDAPAVLGAARARAIGEAHPFGLLIGAVQALKSAGRFEVENAYLAGRMIGSMICEAALLVGDAAAPDEIERQAVAIVDRVLAAFIR